MKKNGFTLIELLIVTVVIVTLMGIVFRLAGVGGDSRKKAKTLARLQRIENAISGYYAAYGSYPPVPLQGRSRDINVQVNEKTGVQGNPEVKRRDANLSEPKDIDKRQIEAACRAQPIAVLFPYFMAGSVNSERKSGVENMINAFKSLLDGNQTFSPLNSPGGLNLDKTEWYDVNLFQFGLLSFLLPRYLFMLQGDPSMYDNPKGQWAANNQLPCRIDTGNPYEYWAGKAESLQYELYKSGNDGKEAALIANLSSQAVCARWMPNFEHIISGGYDFYGVDTADPDWKYLSSSSGIYDALPNRDQAKWIRQFSRKGFEGQGDYLLNGMTIADGWGHEFYYYSEAPYQSYRLWSAGPDGFTFPPWLDVSEFSKKEQEVIVGWTKDDISQLAN